ncbi:hypothetical protein TSUD_89540 [Trifolium subterraneum]|uniref:Uncharacterized protein n=1 Tax=Trifolium subterraneum TaxID=3900 RepID=A0A2Z6P1L6_TRISU|nr:hypothetical protein TSUD_89540 [Trifolium subterraneum]
MLKPSTWYLGTYPGFSHGVANSSTDIPNSEPLNANLLMEDALCSSTKQIEISSVREQNLLVEVVTLVGDLNEELIKAHSTCFVQRREQFRELHIYFGDPQENVVNGGIKRN